MVNRVVSTKLTEEEHSKMLEICNDNGITVSTLIKRAVLEKIKKDQKEQQKISNLSETVEKNNNVQSSVNQSISNSDKTQNEEKYIYF